MTYLLAWKFGRFAYMVADTATTVKQYVVGRPLTSLGEASIREPKRSVYESALKIVNLERAVVAMAGDSSLAQAIAETFKDALRQTAPVRLFTML